MDFDRQLSNALRIEVPDELASRVKLQQVIGDEQRTRIQRVKMYAMAATLVLSIGLSAMLGFTLHQQTGRNEILSHAVIQHINSELYHLTEQRDVQLASLNKILLPLGAHVEQGFGPVNYAGRCLINDKPGAHLVLPGEIGPVTVLVLAGDALEKQLVIDDPRFQGIVLPTTAGSLAVVGEKGEYLESISLRLQAHLRWNL